MFPSFSEVADVLTQDRNGVDGCIQRERSEEVNKDHDDVEGENVPNEHCSRKTPINFLEDLVTLEDLIGPVSSIYNEENFGIDMLEPDNDLSDASVIATQILMNIFQNSWIVIANKPPQKDSFIAATIAINEIFVRAWKIIKPKSRWRMAEPTTWKRNIEKKRRADGLPYITAKKYRPAKVPKAVDCSKCRFKCTVNFSETDRERCCRKYWAQNYTAKKNMILTLIEVKPIQTTVLNRKRTTMRSNSKKYFFYKEGVQFQVCQNFFCKTLCISASVIREAVECRDAMGFYSRDSDPRGRHEPQNKTPPEMAEQIRRHIKSFPTMESHYVRKDIKRQYLDCGLSITKMYALYVEECEKESVTPVSEAKYRNVFCTEFNLGFFVPKKDQCLLCTKYRRLDTIEKTKIEEEYKQHIQRKDACNSEKQRDKERAEKETNFTSASFDLQAILQIPSGDVGLLYYCRKLTIYNLTIYESAFPNEAFCYAWTEVNGKKGSSEIGSIILKYLNGIPDHIEEVSLFSDTCGGQNRNQYVAAVLFWAVQKIDHLKCIEHKFLESGHSHMEVDSMHSSIESAQKHANIYSITEWLNVFRRARSSGKGKRKGQNKKPYNVCELKYTDFNDLKTLSKSMMITKGKTSNGRVKWLKIKRMRYIKGESKIYYNYDMSENFFYIDLEIVEPLESPSLSKTQDQSPSKNHRYGTRLQSKHVKPVQVVTEPPPQAKNGPYLPEILSPLYKEPLYISKAKKNDLIKLCEKGVIPDEYHGWYQSLRADGQKVDRLPDITVSEESEDPEDSDD